MPDYPISLQLRNCLCVVVGGGAVGMRKVGGLVAAGARVRLIAPRDPGLPEGLEGVELIPRPYRRGDLRDAFLAFAATDDRQTNAAIAAEARDRGIPINVGDDPRSGDFHLPAVLRRGPLTVAVSTSGRSPALAAVLRQRLAGELGPEWQTVVEIAAALRRNRLTAKRKTEYNQAILRRLLEGDLPTLIAGGKSKEIDRLLETLFGEGFSLAALGIDLPKGMK